MIGYGNNSISYLNFKKKNVCFKEDMDKLHPYPHFFISLDQLQKNTVLLHYLGLLHFQDFLHCF